MRHRKLEQWGFSVIELIVVVAVILLIAAIALPRMFNARKKASEASVVGSMRAIQIAEAVYQSTYPAKGYSPSLANLGNNGSACETTSPTNACLIDSVLASGLKDGYIFDLLGDGKTPDQSYTLTATPQSSASGPCTFSSDQSGGIQSSAAKPPPGLSAGGASGGDTSCAAGN